MSNTNALTSEVNNGLAHTKPNAVGAIPALKPWEIAELPLFRFKDAQIVDVEHATDAQFEVWRKKHGIPIKDNGIVAWSFEMRCRTINQCRFYGFWDALKFPIDLSAERNTEELDAQKSSDGSPSAPEAG